MVRLMYLSLATLLILAAFPSSVFALNDTPDAAIVLTAQNAGHADRLVGDTGGAVRFYRIDYAGNARPVKIDVTAAPGRDSLGEAFGFKVYGPTGLIGEAPVEYNEPTWTRFSMTLTSAVAGTYLVQIYNYTNGMAVDFNVQATGLDEATVAAGTAAPVTPVGSTAQEPIAFYLPSINVGGSLLGQAGGVMQYFTVEYPGQGTSMTVNLQYSPPSPYENGAVGFNLYRGDTLLGKGAEVRRDASSAVVSFTVDDGVGGPLLLQVYNYEPGFQTNYVLTIGGASAQAVQATGNSSPDRAIVLVPPRSAARGSVGPGNEATFHYFLVHYPGGNREVTFRLTVDAEQGISDKQVGVNLYKGADLAGQLFAYLNEKGDKRTGSFTLVASDAATYGVQVFNYSTTAPARYSLYVSGL